MKLINSENHYTNTNNNNIKYIKITNKLNCNYQKVL